MSKLMLIDAMHKSETRMVILDENGLVEELDLVSSARAQVKGNIYLAKVTRVEPSLQAAFIEYGSGKQGFLPFSEIHPDYYQIPVADRKKLIEEQAALEAENEALQDDDEDFQGDDENDFDGDGEEISDDKDGNDDSSEDDSKKSKPRRRRTHIGRRRYKDKKSSEEQNDSDEKSNDENIATSDDQKPEDDVKADDKTDDSKGKASKDKPNKTVSAVIDNSETTVKSEIIDEDQIDDNDKDDNSKGNSKDEENSKNDIDNDSGSTREKKAKKPRKAAPRRYKIQEVIKTNQIVLVQVVKEERGNKGVSLTTYISLPGRYSVLMPNSLKGGGISRKISKLEDRKRLKKISAELHESRGMSAIIRTAGIDRTKVEIKRDYEYLIKLWNDIRELALSSTAPEKIHEEGDIIKRSIRDYYSANIENIFIQGEAAHKTAKGFMKLIMPSHCPKVKEYKDDIPLFHSYDIEKQLLDLHKPVAKLKSGGYIDINPTEALISIDVNSGRSTSERNVEATAVKTNLEAAKELARQLRIRDLGGLVVVDFIDMYQLKNKKAVERAFKDSLKTDRAKIQIGRIGQFGLLEMSRQRIRPSITETTSRKCGVCKGSGRIRSLESVASEIIRLLIKECSQGGFVTINVIASPEQGLFLLNNYRNNVNELEAKHNIKINFITGDVALDASDFSFEKINEAGVVEKSDRNNSNHNAKRKRKRKPYNKDKNADSKTDNKPKAASENNQQKPDDKKTSLKKASETPAKKTADKPISGKNLRIKKLRLGLLARQKSQLNWWQTSLL